MQTTKEFDTFRILLGMHTGLVFDESDLVRNSIRSALQEWGMAPTKILVAADLQDAQLLLRHSPTILFVDFSVNASDAHAFLEQFVALHPESRRVGIVCNSLGTTKFISEGSADGYLEKPFEQVSLRKELKSAMLLKFYPDSYMKKVLKADEMVRSDQIESAIAEYEAARALSPQPHRAYRGLAEIKRKAGRWNEAIAYYKQATACLQGDYQTMAGEFEVYCAARNFVAAQSLLVDLISIFPHAAERFESIFREAKQKES